MGGRGTGRERRAGGTRGGHHRWRRRNRHGDRPRARGRRRVHRGRRPEPRGRRAHGLGPSRRPRSRRRRRRSRRVPRARGGHRRGAREPRHPRQRRGPPVRRPDRRVPRGEVRPPHEGDGLRPVLVDARRVPAHEGARLGPDREHGLDPLGHRVGEQVRLHDGQARRPRPHARVGPGGRRPRDHRELHLPDLRRHAARPQPDPAAGGDARDLARRR